MQHVESFFFFSVVTSPWRNNTFKTSFCGLLSRNKRVERKKTWWLGPVAEAFFSYFPRRRQTRLPSERFGQIRVRMRPSAGLLRLCLSLTAV